MRLVTQNQPLHTQDIPRLQARLGWCFLSLESPSPAGATPARALPQKVSVLITCHFENYFYLKAVHPVCPQSDNVNLDFHPQGAGGWCRVPSLPGLWAEAPPALLGMGALEGCGAGLGSVPQELMALLLSMAQGAHPVCGQPPACPGGQKCPQSSLDIKSITAEGRGRQGFVTQNCKAPWQCPPFFHQLLQGLECGDLSTQEGDRDVGAAQ